MIKKNVSQLLETEMERKDFLKLIALGAVAATGVTHILKAVTQQVPQRGATTTSFAYGSSPYGGRPNTAKQ